MMNPSTNSALSVRQSLGLTRTQAGQILLGCDNPKIARNMWGRWEREPEKMDQSTRQLLHIIEQLIVARDNKIPGAECALAMVIPACADAPAHANVN